jgi:DNA-binding CsgD family transcriptional regulator
MFATILQELAGSTHPVKERGEGIAFLKVAKSLHPLSTVSYLGFNVPIGAGRKGYVQCSYTDQWVKHCVSRERLPAHRFEGPLAPALREPLDWSALPQTPETQALLQQAGVPGEGQILSFPLSPLAGETALFSIAASVPADEWQAQKKILAREFKILANYFHQHILRIHGHDAQEAMLISARELDCLKWMAAGKTAWEASVILGISERTVRFHLNAAREKLDCLTTTQAVAKAVSQQLI